VLLLDATVGGLHSETVEAARVDSRCGSRAEVVIVRLELLHFLKKLDEECRWVEGGGERGGWRDRERVESSLFRIWKNPKFISNNRVCAHLSTGRSVFSWWAARIDEQRDANIPIASS